MQEILNAIRTVPDFPKPGILFYDISTLLTNAEAFQLTMGRIEELAQESECDLIAAIESRGFVFGAALADRLKRGFVLLRKPGKLPGTTLSRSYKLEYGEAALELSDIALKQGQRVLLIDDVLATGGTAQAATALISTAGASISQALFLLEIPALGGRERLSPHKVNSVLHV